MKANPKLRVVDGRHQRSQRSREALIKASLELIDQGLLVPTAKQIADKAGVGLRSFFRHFEDMEALFAAVDSYARDTIIELFTRQHSNGDLTARIDELVDGQAEAYEHLRNIILSTQAQLWRSPTLRSSYARDQKTIRELTKNWFPELKGCSPDIMEGIDALTSFDMWHRLRHHQKLGVRESKEILSSLISAFFARHGIDG
jgi:AcrR family transcriptional regulator